MVYLCSVGFCLLLIVSRSLTIMQEVQTSIQTIMQAVCSANSPLAEYDSGVDLLDKLFKIIY